MPTAEPEMTLRTTQVSADHWREVLDMCGAIVVGRKLFDFTGGWSRLGAPVVVPTHNPLEGWKDTPFTLEGPTKVTEGTDVTHLRYEVSYS